MSDGHTKGTKSTKAHNALMTALVRVLVVPLAAGVLGAGPPALVQRTGAPVCGRIIAVTCTAPSSSVALLLVPPNEGSVRRLVIPAERRGLFGDRVEERYEQQSACVIETKRTAREAVMTIDDPGMLVVAEKQPAVPFSPDVARTCDPDVRRPLIVRDVKPSYTAEAMLEKVEGRVVVQGVVDATGTVTEARVVHSIGAGLDEEVRRAFLQWRFKPATRAGAPVPIVITLESAFTLK